MSLKGDAINICQQLFRERPEKEDDINEALAEFQRATDDGASVAEEYKLLEFEVERIRESIF